MSPLNESLSYSDEICIFGKITSRPFLWCIDCLYASRIYHSLYTDICTAIYALRYNPLWTDCTSFDLIIIIIRRRRRSKIETRIFLGAPHVFGDIFLHKSKDEIHIFPMVLNSPGVPSQNVDEIGRARKKLRASAELTLQYEYCHGTTIPTMPSMPSA